MDSSGVMGHSGDGNPEYIAERTAVSAIAGGTASVLSGGKFANGAITGAFAQLYNAEAALAKAATRGFAVRFTATAATAAAIAAMDGPLPVGDIIGGGFLIYDVVTTVSGYIFNNDAPNTLEPGEYAEDSIPARGPGRDFTPEERDAINEIGGRTGCHTCGTRDPGTKGGNFIPDHQPPSALNPSGEPQRLYPHCLDCSRIQGGQVRQWKP